MKNHGVKTLYVFFSIFVAAALTGCASMEKSTGLKKASQIISTENNRLAEPPGKWLGSEPHFVMMGKSGNYSFDIQVMEDSPFIKNLTGKREYEKLSSTGEVRFVEWEASLKGLINGVEREIEIGFENADFNDEKIPGIFSLVPEENKKMFPDGIKGPKAGFEIEWEWEIPKGNIFVAVEKLAKSGLFFIEKNNGTDNKDKTLDNGFIGGFGIAELDNGTIYISFTIPVDESEEDFDETENFYE